MTNDEEKMTFPLKDPASMRLVSLDKMKVERESRDSGRSEAVRVAFPTVNSSAA